MRARRRRCRSPFGNRVLAALRDRNCRRRIAVSVSCRRRRERRCMCTSPAATSGRPERPEISSSCFSFPRIIRAAMQFRREPAAARESLPDPERIFKGWFFSGDPERQQAVLQMRFQVLPGKRIGALLRAPAPRGDQRCERAVGLAVRARAAPASGRRRARISLPTISLRPAAFAATCARTIPASEHSSVSASAA